MKHVTSIFLRGIGALLPICLTLYLLQSFIFFLEAFFRRVLMLVLPGSLYFPGLGILVAIAVIIATGIALTDSRLSAIYQYINSLIARIPVIKSIHGIIKDFTDYFTDVRRKKEFNKVVILSIPQLELQLLGFITQEDLQKHDKNLPGEDVVAVYLPMGYQIGGYTLLVNRDQVRPLEMSFQEAMQFILTAGLSSTPGKKI